MILAETKTCYDCGREAPIDHFRLRVQGSPARQGRCRQCYNRLMRERRKAIKTKTLHRFVARVRSETRLNRVISVCNRMIGRYGGVDAFCEAWWEAIQGAGHDNPGGRAVLGSCLALARLLEAVEAKQPAPDVSELTDQELEATVRGYAADLLGSHPELAVELAESIGWAIVPPAATASG